jgi:hypothetical protein
MAEDSDFIKHVANGDVDSLLTQSRDFFGCLRLAHRQLMRQI